MSKCGRKKYSKTNLRQMTMETIDSQQDGSIPDSVAESKSAHMQTQTGQNSIPTLAQVSVAGSGTGRGSPAVTLVQLPSGQTVHVQGVFQTPQPSVIQSPQIQSVQVATIAETDESAESESVIDFHKRRELLSRRPSYRKILNDLSSDVPGFPKIEEEKSEEEGTSPNIAAMAVPTSIYQTSTGQYTMKIQGSNISSFSDFFQTLLFLRVAIAQGGTIQISNPGSDGVQGLQALTMTNSGAPPPGATIVQYAAQSADGTQQFFVPGSQVVVQDEETELAPRHMAATTGDMPTYQIRAPSTALPQGVVMAASPGSLHSPQQLAEEATRKRELRLMKNREAARECRRKKKEYVKCLENRVAVLENQNKTLIEELKALKDLYCRKAE
nr:cAMP-responsive element modulator isoform X1 [Kogia breviceps]XP_058915582.1 cAMP-responsive element modulator isoform X1 [Kogia breviceps]